MKRSTSAPLMLLLSALAMPALAKVSPEEAAKLGAELTPVGAEKAGNKDGSIPAWKPATQKGARDMEIPTTPTIEAEQPLYHRKLDRVPTDGTDTLHNCNVRFPCLTPYSGAEAIWNHKLKWRGEAVQRYNNQMIVQANGEFQQTKIIEDVTFGYASLQSPVPLTKTSGEFLKYLSQTVSPPRLAGTFILVHEKAGTGAEGRAAWLYSPGLKRIRRAPTVCCDNPYEGTDGHQFYDQVDLFNGALDRYNFKLIGKREMYIPYNANRIGGKSVSYKQMATGKHLNPEFPRYELHRVWVVDSELRSGTSHTFKKRRFYLDEDSWKMVAVDAFDSRDQLYQFQEGHLAFATNILATNTSPEVIYHFNSGRYFITAAANEDKPVDLTVKFKGDHFTAAAVQKMSTK